jgi:hypothetical protein
LTLRIIDCNLQVPVYESGKALDSRPEGVGLQFQPVGKFLSQIDMDVKEFAVK